MFSMSRFSAYTSATQNGWVAFRFQTLGHMMQNVLPLHLPSQSTSSQVVTTHLKNISQFGSFSQVGMKIKNIWNHHRVHIRNMPHNQPGPKPNAKTRGNRFPSWRLDLKVAVPFATDRSVLVTSAGVSSFTTTYPKRPSRPKRRQAH